MFGSDCHKKLYGVGTVGEKGQIVIPAEAREELKIKPGDKFVFFGHGSVLHLMDADRINDILDRVTSFSEKADKIKKSIQTKIKETE